MDNSVSYILFPLASFVVLLTLIFTSMNSPDNRNAFLLCGIFLVIANIAVFYCWIGWIAAMRQLSRNSLWNRPFNCRRKICRLWEKRIQNNEKSHTILILSLKRLDAY